MRDVLPDWNDLPQELRSELRRLGEATCCACCAEATGGDLAVQFYATLRAALPAPVFPLFQPRMKADPPEKKIAGLPPLFWHGLTVGAVGGLVLLALAHLAVRLVLQ